MYYLIIVGTIDSKVSEGKKVSELSRDFVALMGVCSVFILENGMRNVLKRNNID